MFVNPPKIEKFNKKYILSASTGKKEKKKYFVNIMLS